MKTSNWLFEFEDLKWFPDTIRQGMMDYLRFLFSLTNLYKPVAPIISEGLNKTGSNTIVDLCSGGGGAIEKIYTDVKASASGELQVILTDKFPNVEAFRHLSKQSKGGITFKKDAVDAVAVSKELKGFRTMFSAMHHFNKNMAGAILKNAVNSKTGIGIFDGGDRNILVILLVIIVHSIGFILFTPLIKPFKLSRIFFTYIIPLIPLFTIWDGIVSIVRLHDPADLLSLAKKADDKNYTWKAGRIKNSLGLNIAYLVGYPTKSG